MKGNGQETAKKKYNWSELIKTTTTKNAKGLSEMQKRKSENQCVR